MGNAINSKFRHDVEGKTGNVLILFQLFSIKAKGRLRLCNVNDLHQELILITLLISDKQRLCKV